MKPTCPHCLQPFPEDEIVYVCPWCQSIVDQIALSDVLPTHDRHGNPVAEYTPDKELVKSFGQKEYDKARLHMKKSQGAYKTHMGVVICGIIFALVCVGISIALKMPAYAGISLIIVAIGLMTFQNESDEYNPKYMSRETPLIASVKYYGNDKIFGIVEITIDTKGLPQERYKREIPTTHISDIYCKDNCWHVDYKDEDYDTLVFPAVFELETLEVILKKRKE